MDANLTCSPPVKNLTDGEQRSAFRGIFRGEQVINVKSHLEIKHEVWKDIDNSFHT